MTKVNANNDNETKSNIFPLGIFKFDILFHWLQNAKICCKKMLKNAKECFDFIAKVSTNK